MRRSHLVFLLPLLIAAALLNGVALAHVHDSSAPGLQNAQCPYVELAPRSVGVLPSPPDLVQFYSAPLPLSVAVDAPAPQEFTAPASPRGPPHPSLSRPAA